MYSDSDDDSQLSQPHLFVRKKSSITEPSRTSNQDEDVIDRERPSIELINFSDSLQVTNLKDASTSTSHQTMNPTDKLLMKFSSSDSSNPSDAISSETSLGEVLGDNESLADEVGTKKLTNRSQQTSPTLLNRVSFGKNLNSIDLEELKKYESVNSLESTIYSPEIAPFQSKYLRNWHRQQRLYYEQKQSIESLNDPVFDSKLTMDTNKVANTNRPDEEDVLGSLQKKQFGIFNFEFDEELFYKVKKLFPQVSEKKIRTFMFKHHNQEHDVIRATINSLSPKREKRRLKHQSAMDKVLGNYIRMHRQIDQLDEERERLMAKDEQQEDRNYAKVQIKIRYLKLFYPDADVLELFYLLHDCDMRTNIVAKKLEEELGYKRSSLSESEESLVSPLHFEELMPELNLNFGEQQDLINNLQNEYPLIDVFLVKSALKSTRFNEVEARKLLDTVDVDQYKNAKVFEFDRLAYSRFIFKTERGTQTSHIDYADFGRTYKVERKKNNYLTKCQSTWTKEDNMQKIFIKQTAKGPDLSNIKGPVKRERTKLITPKGPDPSNYRGNDLCYVRGSDAENVRGCDLENLINSPSSTIGPNPANCLGSEKLRPKNWLYDDESDDRLSYDLINKLPQMSNIYG